MNRNRWKLLYALLLAIALAAMMVYVFNNFRSIPVTAPAITLDEEASNDAQDARTQMRKSDVANTKARGSQERANEAAKK